jgi:hypothetical protein
MTTTTHATPDHLPNVLTRSVAVNISRSLFGVTRKVRGTDVDIVPTTVAPQDDDGDGTAEAKPNQRLLSVHKRLLNCAELRAVAALDRDLQEWMQAKCLPSFFRPGIYLVPHALVATVEAALEAHVAKRAALVDAFVRHYPARVAEMRASLGALFNGADYPDAEGARAAFAFRWEWLDLAAPARLRRLDARIFAAAQARAAAQQQEVAQQIRDVLRASMLELVDHMRDRLTGTTTTGKPKVFRDTMVARLRAFLDDFPSRDLTDDDDLRALVGRARGMLAGVAPDDLRADGAVRDRVAADMEAIGAELAAMTTGRARAITFTNDD